MQSAWDIPSFFVHLYTCTVLWFSNGTEMEDPRRYSGGEGKPSSCFYKYNVTITAYLKLQAYVKSDIW